MAGGVGRLGARAPDPVRLMKGKRRVGWERLKTLALALDLPGVVESTAWGEPVLKVHGKL